MRARVTPRTIRYYVEQGVLPPPGRGRPAEYTGEHLRRLALVRRLKDQYLPLEEIRDTMQRLTLDEVEELLAHSSAQAKRESVTITSASEYIANVLDHTAVREQMKRDRVQAPTPPPAPSPAYSPLQVPVQSPDNDFAQGDTSVSKAARKRSMPGQAQVEQTALWQRITLATGIELHYIQTTDAHTNRIAAQIQEAAQDLLDNDPGEYMEEPQ